ncbi:MAG: hypothetical protein FGM32_09220, partial [Candidatus Kapabacteria bacterium]|nr:hypothetical protein [Candidatus Kapabacteria bacterium]
MATRQVRHICTLLAVLVIGSSVALAQVDTTEPPRPTVLPEQFTSPVPRVFQVYGSISGLYRDRVRIGTVNGDSIEVDSIRRRSQMVTYGSAELAPGAVNLDTVYMYSTLGLTSIDVLQ